MTNIKQLARPLSRVKIRDFAKIIRRSIDAENTPYFDVIAFLEIVMPIVDKNFEYIYLPKNEMRGCYGMAYPEEHRIYIREDVYDRAINNVGRDRFTIMHEIAHYFLHTKDNLILTRLAPHEKIPKYYDLEWQANTLAAETLVFLPLIKNKSIQEIITTCAVSYEVAKIQKKFS